MLDVNIDTDGFFEVDKFISKYLPDAVGKATTRSLNKISQKIRTQVTRSVSRDSGIKPAKLVRQRISLFKATKRRKATGVRFLYYSIPAHAWGDITWNRQMKGAKAGRKSFPGSFAATPTAGGNKGKRRIYDRVSRTGNPQKDLRMKSFTLRPYRAELARIGKKIVSRELADQFNEQLKYEVGKKGFSL